LTRQRQHPTFRKPSDFRKTSNLRDFAGSIRWLRQHAGRGSELSAGDISASSWKRSTAPWRGIGLTNSGAALLSHECRKQASCARSSVRHQRSHSAGSVSGCRPATTRGWRERWNARWRTTACSQVIMEGCPDLGRSPFCMVRSLVVLRADASCSGEGGPNPIVGVL
jgi:hypothetical protein